MKKYQPPIKESEEEYEDIQLKEWIAESHFWVKRYGTFICKWCNKITTTSLSGDAILYLEKP